MISRFQRLRFAATFLVACLSLLITLSAAHAQQKQSKLVPDVVKLAPSVRSTLDDKLLKDSERNALRLFHGQFNELPADIKSGAEYKLLTWDISDPIFKRDDTPAVLRAEAALDRGDTDVTIKLLEGDASPRARLLLGQAYIDTGKFDLAVKTLTPLREALQKQDPAATAAQIAAMAQGVALLAMLEGRSVDDYQFVIDQLTRAQQQVDRLYWPALVAQAELLIDKDNPEEAVAALHQALALNPSSCDAWYLIGRVALRGYDFTSVTAAANNLRGIQPDHVLADVLDAEAYLQQKDPVSAQRIIDAGLKRYPHHRRLLACAAAAAAIRYDETAEAAAIKRFEEISGRSALAYYVTGLYLSIARQYEPAEKALARAVALQPNWAQPQIELGLMLSQAGKEEAAIAVLRRVAQLDPYNKRAVNTLKMHEELAGYHTVETPHFTIRYRDPIDRALALDMPEPLERFYTEVGAAFDYRLRGKTAIEIMADKRWFAVRITGMPDIWTIAACTGSVIALTPPREGVHQAGPFDWMRVIRHEYTHTVTLERTMNRVPHWFTEACAVSQEPEPRDYNTCQLLAAAVGTDGGLFTLDGINWGFVRPKKATDRNLAYAQSHWMFEYIVERYGHKTILKILDLARDGVPENEIVPRATNQSAAEFLSGFRAWAIEKVAAWGLSPSPPTAELMKEIETAGSAKLDTKLAELLAKHADHPDLLRLAAESALKKGNAEAAVPILLHYASVRPVDPWADARLAELFVKLGRPAEAISHLEQLDRYDQTTGEHAQTLTRLYRQLEQFDNAQRASARALARQPYNADLREIAATIALQRGDMPTALRHIQSLTWIEPERSTHFVRLAAICAKMNKPEDAKAAALQARKLDPKAPVEKFLTP